MLIGYRHAKGLYEEKTCFHLFMQTLPKVELPKPEPLITCGSV
ncbi:hypothetical protein NSE_0606 [Neorickettsia sennetsu str. Miyayama]|uniref:Uncharacterized protein n=1 Tax=Ehrlichia sennetsu (strain ATCC VR-367 / Miyayama) TaxID=222891 RepID=Q2GDG0_EHRS3|nr:hypothetical protein NSE_0606 [Neorickettsia sennetsu str. Miyayama]